MYNVLAPVGGEDKKASTGAGADFKPSFVSIRKYCSACVLHMYISVFSPKKNSRRDRRSWCGWSLHVATTKLLSYPHSPHQTILYRMLLGPTCLRYARENTAFVWELCTVSDECRAPSAIKNLPLVGIHLQSDWFLPSCSSPLVCVPLVGSAAARLVRLAVLGVHVIKAVRRACTRCRRSDLGSAGPWSTS